MRGSATRERQDLHHRGDELHLLREVVRTYQVLMSVFTRKTGMPASRLAVMRHLALSEGEVGVTDLARELGINPAAVTRRVQELERERLVTRRADSRDRRRSHVRLSAKGKTLFEEIHARSHELERSVSAALGPDDVAAAARTLASLRAFLERLR